LRPGGRPPPPCMSLPPPPYSDVCKSAAFGAYVLIQLPLQGSLCQRIPLALVCSWGSQPGMWAVVVAYTRTELLLSNSTGSLPWEGAAIMTKKPNIDIIFNPSFMLLCLAFVRRRLSFIYVLKYGLCSAESEITVMLFFFPFNQPLGYPLGH
jgi:hypothetical protein